jgi:hypothetical protein
MEAARQGTKLKKTRENSVARNKRSKIMKVLSILSIGLAVTFSTQAALVRIALSPPGTDVAVGLSPTNEVPPAVTSTGSGGEISAGITLDTDTSILHLAVGYGSAAGFTDLTGPATAMHIHGPVGAGTNAGVLVSLVPYHFPATTPAQGGVIYGIIPWPTNQTANLLAGLTYLNIHTTQFPGGEIRGQLIPINEAPVVVCPEPATVDCGTPATAVALVSDPEGDALAVVWTLNGVAVETNTLPARGPGLPAMASFSQTLPVGTNVVDVAVTDTAGNTSLCSTLITVEDTTPPVIAVASANPDELWPPNHKLVDVVVRARVMDNCSDTTWKIVGVRSNQPKNGRGDGNTQPDWVITGNHTLKLRAERAGGQGARVYSIILKATDAAGNISAPKVVTVTVPQSQGHDKGPGHGNGKG